MVTKYPKKILVISIFASVPIIFFLGLVNARGYWFLLINLFLACLPAVFAFLSTRSKPYFASFFLFGWFIFFPNAPYLWTDIIHPFGVIQYACPSGQAVSYCDEELIRTLTVPQWSGSVAQIFSLSVTLYVILIGTLIGIYSYKLVLGFVTKRLRLLFCLLVIVSASFGIVMGRFARTNSWYIITHPLRLLDDVYSTVIGIITQPLYLSVFLISIVYTAFMLLPHTLASKKLDT